MAQDKNSSNTKKIFNCPVRAKIHSISHKTPTNKTSSKPVQIVHQSQTIPIDSESPIVSSVQNATKSSSPRGHVEKVEIGPSGIVVPAAKTKSRKDDDDDDDDDVAHQKVDEVKENDKFSDYITKVKDKMRSVSSVGRSATIRDSFNDKVSSYINRARIKMRTTASNVGDDKNVSFK